MSVEILNTVCSIVHPLAGQPCVSFLIARICSFISRTEESYLKQRRRTLRIIKDTKGIVVKMLITMLTAMYMVVKVVESVR